ncbi:MAG: ABC transporter ATP-binding protein [Desulfurococcaceae archaeon]|nr:ABC transporter ATP-binding protein [Sulfolobales archaeon]MDW8170677.1 ABC transporter ATP-binding protein [Desulfurococcaceae archaeon]
MLEVSNLRSGYGRIEILHGVDLRVEKGEVVAVLGPNGAGKTTLLNTLFGLADVYSGSITYEGRSIAGLKPYELVKLGLSYAPQLSNVFSELTVVDNLIMGAYVRIRDPSVKGDIEEVFKLFPELEKRRSQKAKTLSGGERQMLAVARALMSKPRVLLLDEPTSGLSPKAGSALMSKIRDVRSAGVTILLVEQNVRRALEVADRVYVLIGGRIVRESPALELKMEEVEKLFLSTSAKA